MDSFGERMREEEACGAVRLSRRCPNSPTNSQKTESFLAPSGDRCEAKHLDNFENHVKAGIVSKVHLPGKLDSCAPTEADIDETGISILEMCADFGCSRVRRLVSSHHRS